MGNICSKNNSVLDDHRPQPKRLSSEKKVSTPITPPTEVPKASPRLNEEIISQNNIVHSPKKNSICSSQEEIKIDYIYSKNNSQSDNHRQPTKRSLFEDEISTPITHPTEVPKASPLPNEKIISPNNAVHSSVKSFIDLKPQEDQVFDFGSPLTSPIGNSDEESLPSIMSSKSFRFFPQTISKNPEKNAPELFQRIKQRFDGHKTQTLTQEDIENTLSALMIIKKVSSPNLGATSNHWDVTLEQFEGNKSWLLRNDKDEYSDSLNINQLLRDRDVRGHSKQVNALLNAQNNIYSTWDDLFKMLCRPIIIQHPHTKKNLWVIIDMKFKEHDKQQSKDSLVLNVTLRPTVSPSMQDSNDCGKRKNVHFKSLLHESRTSNPTPPQQLASEFTPKETIIGEPESYHFEQNRM